MRNRATTQLAKPKVRMSMSKFNLYNLSRIALPGYKVFNFFQQKWKSKSVMRDYHGEQVRERQWERIFMRNKRLRGVVPMDAAYLASNDGSNESAGRGSGLEKDRGTARVEHTPYMMMTFAPLERRLDVAIFRALFASSARQARQFVVHGAVKVNGKMMRYPGYFLNPGDMFQVNPERVLFALGKPRKSDAATEAEDEVVDEEVAAAEDVDQAGTEPTTSTDPDSERTPKAILKDLMKQAKDILASEKDNLGGKRKADLRAFSKSVRNMLSKSGRETVLTDSLEAQFQELQNQLQIRGIETKDSAKPEVIQSSPSPDAAEEPNYLSATDSNDLYAALRAMSEAESESESDPSTPKPYATPWMPREYLSAFAFIPRYLEVNQNICAAVYLRHPVARPGMAEVPTPFPEMINANAFAWYLRRR